MSQRDTSSSCEATLHSESLTGRDHPQITQHLTPLKSQELTNVGLRLGLRYPTLQKMNQESLLNEMVNAWLRRDDDVAEVGEPTWESLNTALKACGHNGIASDITNREIGEDRQHHHSDQQGNNEQPRANRHRAGKSIHTAVDSSSQAHGVSQNPQEQINCALSMDELMGEHPSYHQSIPGEEAKRRLKQFASHCYLTRYSEELKCYVLSVYKKQNPQDTIKHFKIEKKQNRKYQIKGKESELEEFNEIGQLLSHYEFFRIDPSLRTIGRACTEEQYKRIDKRERNRRRPPAIRAIRSLASLCAKH